MSEDFFTCHSCHADKVRVVPAFSELSGIASDSRVWSFKARIGKCDNCGSIVKETSPEWFETINQIYSTYQMYHQSNGAEKLDFDPKTGEALPRSQRLVNALLDFEDSKNIKKSLDIGTGNGAMLRALSTLIPNIELWAQDLSSNSLHELEEISGFKGLLTQSLDEIGDKFDLVSMIHVLEHVPNPVSFLKEAKKLLKPSGHLIVNIPDATLNPIDLLVTDHCSHFGLNSIMGVVRSAGLHIAFARNDLLSKELVLFCVLSEYEGASDINYNAVDTSYEDLQSQVYWLQQVLVQGKEILEGTDNSIFGASLGGAWLGGNIENWTGKFVDEDESRVGNDLLGHNIISPSEVSEKNTVYIPLATHIAKGIADRYSDLSGTFKTPEIN